MKRAIKYHLISLSAKKWIFCLKFIVSIMLCSLVWSGACLAEFSSLNGHWYEAKQSEQLNPNVDLSLLGLKEVNTVALTGGRYWHQVGFDVAETGRYVIDFKNSSTISHFKHILLDAQGKTIIELNGGIESTEINPFFLRHGREVQLAAGHYRLLTELDSLFYLAYPQPYIASLADYQQGIKAGNALTMLCLGIFIGLMVYYVALALVRWRLSEAMYSTFILGNILYNGAALLVFSDLINVHSMYLVGFPILFSNAAYILFVLSLLEVRRNSHPRLFKIAMVLLSILAAFVVMALINPHWSLELQRYGVILFLIYGLSLGLIRAFEGSVSARFYLLAIGVFFVLAIFSVTANHLSFYTIYIEHFGLVSVAIEAMLLASVLSYQFAQLYQEKQHALERLEYSTRISLTDDLTGLPNRMALDAAIQLLPMQGSITFIDIDGLKHYNDQYGHERGDQLLCSFALYLTASLGKDAKAHRLGGDEFAITCESGNLDWVEQSIGEAVEGMRMTGFELAGASSGSVYVHEDPSKANLMHMADTRMYSNKRLRKLSHYANKKPGGEGF